MCRALSAFGVVCCLAASGCGLSEYEKQMDTERKRLDEYDIQTKYLGPPIKFLESSKEEGKKDKDEAKKGQTARAFIRPPKDITTTSSTKEGSVLRVYPVVGSAALSATFQAFYLGVGLNQKQADFRNAVLAAFRISGTTNMTDVNVDPTGKPARVFHTLQAAAPSPMGDATLYIHFYEEGPYQVAIIYKVLNSKAGPEVHEAIRYSLRSLAVGQAAITAESRLY